MKTILGKYQYDPQKDRLGAGGYGTVYKAKHIHLDEWRAMKFYQGELSDYDVIKEIRKMIGHRHPNLIRFFDADIMKSTNLHGEEVLVQVGVMEYVNGGTLSEFWAKHTDPLVRKKIITDILRGMVYLQMNRIVHRDLKPANILIQKEDNGEFTAKIADFGLAKCMDQSSTASMHSLHMRGTPEYMAPEQFIAEKYGINGRIGTNVDIWALGVILYELFKGKLPFGSRDSKQSMAQIMENIAYYKSGQMDLNGVPAPYDEVIRKCLVKKASERIDDCMPLYFLVANHGAEIPETYKDSNVNEHSFQALEEIFQEQETDRASLDLDSLADELEQAELELKKEAEVVESVNEPIITKAAEQIVNYNTNNKEVEPASSAASASAIGPKKTQKTVLNKPKVKTNKAKWWKVAAIGLVFLLGLGALIASGLKRDNKPTTVANANGNTVVEEDVDLSNGVSTTVVKHTESRPASENSAVEKLKEIDVFSSEAKDLKTGYEQFKTKGDAFFEEQDFLKALIAYREAMKYQIEDEYCRTKINMCKLDLKLPSLKQEKQKQHKLNWYLKEADKRWERKLYSDALDFYQHVLKQQADNAYCQEKVYVIKSILNTFDSFLKEGKSLEKQSDYTKAMAQYENAMRLNPFNELAQESRDRCISALREKS